MNLVLAVERAAESFHNGWRPRLGPSVKQGMEKEHWTRIKARSRRFAMGSDEHDTLRPVADLKQQLQQRLNVPLQNPVAWNGPVPTNDDKQHIFDAIAEDLSRRLLDLASRRVKSERLSDWRSAYAESGPRSTSRRAKPIAERVYDLAAPVPTMRARRKGARAYAIDDAIGFMVTACGLPQTQASLWVCRAHVQYVRSGLIEEDHDAPDGAFGALA